MTSYVERKSSKLSAKHCEHTTQQEYSCSLMKLNTNWEYGYSWHGNILPAVNRSIACCITLKHARMLRDNLNTLCCGDQFRHSKWINLYGKWFTSCRSIFENAWHVLATKYFTIKGYMSLFHVSRLCYRIWRSGQNSQSTLRGHEGWPRGGLHSIL